MYFKVLYKCVTQYVCMSKGYQVMYKEFLCKVQITISLKASVIWSLQGGSVIQCNYCAA